MDYRYLLRRSLALMRRYRALWILGILASLVGGVGVSNFRYSPGSSSIMNLSDLLREGKDLLLRRPGLVVILATAIVVLLMIFIFISLVSRAALILAVYRVEAQGEKKIVMRRTFREGIAFFWGFLAIYLIALVGYTAIGYGAVALVLSSWGNAGLNWTIYLTAPLAALGLLVCYALLVTVQYFSLRAIALESAGTWSSLVRATRLLASHLGDCAKLALTYLVVYVGVVGALALALGLPLYYYVIEPVRQQSGSGPALVTTILIALLSYPLLLIVDGMLGAYINGMYTIGFLQVNGMWPHRNTGDETHG